MTERLLLRGCWVGLTSSVLLLALHSYERSGGAGLAFTLLVVAVLTGAEELSRRKLPLRVEALGAVGSAASGAALGHHYGGREGAWAGGILAAGLAITVCLLVQGARRRREDFEEVLQGASRRGQVELARRYAEAVLPLAPTFRHGLCGNLSVLREEFMLARRTLPFGAPRYAVGAAGAALEAEWETLQQNSPASASRQARGHAILALAWFRHPRGPNELEVHSCRAELDRLCLLRN